jgi:ribosomal protein L11 methyltransferase
MSQTTFTAFTTLSGKAPAEALGAAVEEIDPAPYGVGVFEVEDGSGTWEVGAYFLETPDAVALALLAAAHGAADFVVSELPDTDWVAHVRRELHPVEAGRFYVYGSHDAETVPSDRIGLLIEAAMAFGTGHHGTTHGCLLAFERLLEMGVAPGKVADIGCGTAVLAMAAAKVWPGMVYASDMDPTAVEVARVNADVNGLADRITCIEAAGFDHPALSQAGPFDLIFANILMGPLLELGPDMATNVSFGGHVILSGILNEQAEEVIRAYKSVGFALVHHHQTPEWSTLLFKNH